MSAYYNEIDPAAAAWLRELIKMKLIADGEVDERSIVDVVPDELAGFTQCHFFAGIGVWSYALRQAGWPDDKPVWTGSCPCQPFSAAGKGDGMADERHLWPDWQYLIEQCRPRVVFGEQVEAAIKHGWLDLVQADLEGIGYAFRAVGIPAAGVGAPHIRGRLYFVADCESNGHERCGEFYQSAGRASTPHGGTDGGVAVLHGDGCGARLAVRSNGEEHDTQYGSDAHAEHPGPTNGFWRDADWLFCRDGKWRPVEPGTFPLVAGSTKGMVRSSDTGEPTSEARVMRLKGYGNAINADVATAFIRAYMVAQ